MPSLPTPIRAPTQWLPKLVLAPSFALSMLFIYGFMLWNGYLSLSVSRLLPNYEFVGLAQYGRLFESDRFHVAITNMGIFGALFIGGAMTLGILLAILLDQKIRIEGALRTIYLYPMAISFIVTGTAWKWLLNPGLGLQHLMRQWGFESFTFEWLVEPERAIYCIVIAGVWQCAGFVMALFLAGLRGIDDSIIKAAQLDGAGFWLIFRRIIVPLSMPITVVTLIWQFTNIWNDFLYGVVFSGADSKPVTVGLNNLANTSSVVKEYNVDMAAAIIAALPTLLVYALAGKYFVRGLTAGAVNG